MLEAARLLASETDGPFFLRARQSELLADSGIRDQLKSYSEMKGETPEKQKIEGQILNILNDLLLDKELFAKTFEGVDPQKIDPDIGELEEAARIESSHVWACCPARGASRCCARRIVKSARRRCGIRSY